MLNWHTLILTASLLLLAAVTLWIKWQQRKETYEAILAPVLEALGFQFVSSRAPRPFDKGPFAPAKASPAGRRVRGRGNFDVHRIVRFKDGGEVREAWARLEFEGGRPVRIAWRPELASFSLPVGKT